MVETICIRSEKLPKQTKSSVERLKFPRHIGNQYRESISGNRFTTTGSRINALTAHAQTLSSCLKHTALDGLRSTLEHYPVYTTN